MAVQPPPANFNLADLISAAVKDPNTAAASFAGQPPPTLPTAPAPQPSALTAAAATSDPFAGVPLEAGDRTLGAVGAPAEQPLSAMDRFAQAAQGVEAPQVKGPNVNLGNAPRPGLGGQQNPQMLQMLMQMLQGAKAPTGPQATLGQLIGRR